MGRKLSINDMHSLANERGGRCISLMYVNSDTHLIWECGECGKQWKATPHCVKSGTWCPVCSAKRAWDRRGRYSALDMKKLAKKHGLTFISGVYKGTKRRHLWKCSNGHKFKSTPSNVRAGKSCPYCHKFFKEEQCRFAIQEMVGLPFPKTRCKNFEFDGFCRQLGIVFEYQGEQHYHACIWNDNGRRLSLQQKNDAMKAEFCVENGFRLLVIPYLNATTQQKLDEHIRIELKNIGIDPKPVRWKNFSGKSSDLAHLRNICIKKQIRCLSVCYVSSTSKMHFECLRCNCQWFAEPRSIKFGTGCPECSKRRISDKLRKLDYSYIQLLRRSGRTLKEVANELGCSISAVYYAEELIDREINKEKRNLRELQAENEKSGREKPQRAD